MKFSNEVKVGLLTIVSLAVLFVGFNYLRGSSLFSNTDSYYGVYSKVDGLTVSKPVLVNGFEIGRVADMRLLENGRIKVRFDVSRNYRIPKNTIANLQSTDLLGNKAILFILGNSTEEANEGDTLKASTEKSLSETVAPLQSKTERLLTRIDSLLGSLSAVVNPKFQKNVDRSISSVANTLENLEAFTKSVNRQTPKIGLILGDVRSLTENLKSNSGTISSILNNFKNISDNAAKMNFVATMGKVDSTMNQLNTVIGKINSGQGSLGLLINDKQLYTNLTNSTASLNKLMVDLKANPKRYVSFSIFGGGGKKKKADTSKSK